MVSYTNIKSFSEGVHFEEERKFLASGLKRV